MTVAKTELETPGEVSRGHSMLRPGQENGFSNRDKVTKSWHSNL